MQVKIELRHEKAVMPSKANPTDCGFDLTSVSRNITANYVEYDTGLAVEIPEGYAGFIFPRSSVSKYGLVLANCVGIIDPCYVGNVKLRFKLVDDYPVIYEVGDRVGQLIIMPLPNIELVDGVVNGSRSGFGSSGV